MERVERQQTPAEENFPHYKTKELGEGEIPWLMNILHH